MEKNILLKTLLGAMVWIQTVYAQFDVLPKNSFVMKGDSVVLDCKATGVDTPGVFPGAQQWQEYYTDGSPQSIASDANIFRDYVDEFEIVTDTQYNLRLITGQSQLKHGAKYGCQNVFDSNQNTFAEVIVLDSDPVCTADGPNNPQGIVIENDTVTYSCQIKYQGRWAPIQLWRDKNGNEVPHLVGDDNDEGSVVHTYVTFSAKVLDDGQKFNCQTKFGELTPNPPGDNEDSTIPSYDNSTAFQTLIVHYPPRDTQITDMTGNPVSQLYPGEEIKCISTSNPAINNVLWQNSTDNSTLADNNTEVLVIQEEWLGNAAIRCVVKNIMGPVGNTKTGEHSTEITVSVVKGSRTTKATTTTTTTTTTTPVPITTISTTTPKDPKTDPSTDDPSGLSAGAIAGIVVVIVAVIVIVIIIIVFCMRRNGKEKDAEASRPPKSVLAADHVRQADVPKHNMPPYYPTNSMEKHPDIATIDRNGPPPYNGDYSYDSQDPGSNYGTDDSSKDDFLDLIMPRNRNVENIVYADLALDDTPRSRKPIQVYEPTDYAEIKRV